MSIILVQRHISSILIIDYIEDDHKTLDYYAAKLNSMPLNWGYDWLPHDGNTKDFKTGKSTAEILKTFGRKTKQVPNIAIEAGIKAARQTFGQIYFDKDRTTRLVECLKRYRRSVPASTGEPGSPVHDEFSHGADAFRYLGVVSDMLRNEDERPPPVVAFSAYDSTVGY
jgi:phage terminase large subunit